MVSPPCLWQSIMLPCRNPLARAEIAASEPHPARAEPQQSACKPHENRRKCCMIGRAGVQSLSSRLLTVRELIEHA